MGSSTKPASSGPSAAPNVLASARRPVAAAAAGPALRKPAPSKVNSAPDAIAVGNTTGAATAAIVAAL
jgi:hypothetical protein